MKRRPPARSATAQTIDQVPVKSVKAVVLTVPEREGGRVISGLLVGELVALLDGGRTPLVIFDGQAGSAAVPARTLIDLGPNHIGGQVALMFEHGDNSRPVITGQVRNLPGSALSPTPNHVDVAADGQQLTVTAKEKVVIQCGEASITLTRDGQILLRGTYVLSRSSGANRIKGGSVQIN